MLLLLLLLLPLLLLLQPSLGYSVKPSLYDPVELVNFNLIDNNNNMERARYELADGGRARLPLLSRGERESGDLEALLDGTREPSCRELRSGPKVDPARSSSFICIQVCS